MVTKIQRFDGLVIDKSTSSQTICQTTKYQTRVGGISPYAIYAYREYRGIKGLSKYRRIPGISHIETLNVSNNGTGGRGGYREDTHIPIGLYTYNKPYIGGYADMNGLGYYGLDKINKNKLWFFLFLVCNPVRVLTKHRNHKQ